MHLSFTDSNDASAKQTIAVDIRRNDAGISLAGSGSLDLRLWSPVIALLGIDVIKVESGAATLRFEGEIAHDPNQIPIVYADVTPTTPILLTFPETSDTIRSITVISAGATEISATIPELQWSLRQEAVALRVADASGNDAAVSLINLSCESGTTCSADVSVVMENAVLPFVNVSRFEYAATQHVAVGEDGMQVLVEPNASLAMTGISGMDIELAGFAARLTTTAELNLSDAGWQFFAQSADVEIEEYSVVDELGFSAQIFVDDISFSDGNQLPSVKFGAYASSSQAHLGNQIIRLPGFKGGVAKQGEEVAVFLETDGLFAEASIEASHNLGNEAGQLSVSNAGLSFDSQELASRVAPWPHNWNVSGGVFGIGLNANWLKQDMEWQVTAQVSVRLANLAGAWNDTAFAGLSTSIDATIDTATGIAIQPSTIEVALIEMGLPIENIRADYTLRPAGQAVDVENLRMTAFGGVVTADPFSFSTANERNTLLLRASSIDLAEILSIKEFEAIEISGSIGAELPVTIEGAIVSVAGGTLTGEPPGGVIRYLPGVGSAQTDASGIGIATRALSNFEYETLTSEVDYTTDGDLNLQMRLTGRNPNLEDNRPVILNLGLENNIPQMLRSLQAARAVEEILERRIAQ
jgi:hypothetical protein